jgi:hypothetical protein
MGHKYIPDPQIMFAAFSNGRCDRVPLQVGQFESDNRLDENLENMVMGGPLAGGCDPQESSELMLYLAARHTSIDCWEKRQRKGYMFIITDEPAYTRVKQEEVNRIISPKLRDDIALEAMVKEAAERFHLFIVVPASSGGKCDPAVLEFYKSYVGPENVLELLHPDDISETMTLAIGLTERAITLDDGLRHLQADGAGPQTIDALRASLSAVAGQSVKGTGLGLNDLSPDDKKGSKRL